MDDPTRPTRVLVAEDDADLAELLVEVLGRDGHDVRVVRSGERLLQELGADASYDVVVADVRLGGLTSLEALARTEAERRPAVVIVTGAASPEVERAARALGVARVLSKPFDLNVLGRTVRELASRSRSAHDSRTDPDQDADPKRHA